MAKTFSIYERRSLARASTVHVHCLCGAILPSFDPTKVDAEVLCAECGQTFRLRVTVEYLNSDVWNHWWDEETETWRAEKRTGPPALLGTQSYFAVHMPPSGKTKHKHIPQSIPHLETIPETEWGCTGQDGHWRLQLDASRARSLEKRQIVAIYTCDLCGKSKERKIRREIAPDQWLAWLREQSQAAELKTK